MLGVVLSFVLVSARPLASVRRRRRRRLPGPLRFPGPHPAADPLSRSQPDTVHRAHRFPQSPRGRGTIEARVELEGSTTSTGGGKSPHPTVGLVRSSQGKKPIPSRSSFWSIPTRGSNLAATIERQQGTDHRPHPGSRKGIGFFSRKERSNPTAVPGVGSVARRASRVLDRSLSPYSHEARHGCAATAFLRGGDPPRGAPADAALPKALCPLPRAQGCSQVHVFPRRRPVESSSPSAKQIQPRLFPAPGSGSLPHQRNGRAPLPPPRKCLRYFGPPDFDLFPSPGFSLFGIMYQKLLDFCISGRRIPHPPPRVVRKDPVRAPRGGRGQRVLRSPGQPRPAVRMGHMPAPQVSRLHSLW